MVMVMGWKDTDDFQENQRKGWITKSAADRWLRTKRSHVPRAEIFSSLNHFPLLINSISVYNPPVSTSQLGLHLSLAKSFEPPGWIFWWRIWLVSHSHSLAGLVSSPLLTISYEECQVTPWAYLFLGLPVNSLAHIRSVVSIHNGFLNQRVLWMPVLFMLIWAFYLWDFFWNGLIDIVIKAKRHSPPNTYCLWSPVIFLNDMKHPL